jgi:hypothetical protein
MTVIAFLEKSVFVDFNDVLEEYSRRQGELLDVLRQFRTEYSEPLSGASQAPLLAASRGSAPAIGHRLPPPTAPVRPSPPTTGAHRPILPPRPEPVGPALEQRTWGDEVFGSAVHHTKRDYDYFSELDERLGGLGSAGEGAA